MLAYADFGPVSGSEVGARESATSSIPESELNWRPWLLPGRPNVVFDHRPGPGAREGIRFAESALADLESIRARYAEQDVPEVGERLIGEIVASIEALVDHPDMGRIVPEFDQPFLRELIRPPFRVVDRRDPKHVRVVRAGAVPATS